MTRNEMIEMQWRYPRNPQIFRPTDRQAMKNYAIQIGKSLRHAGYDVNTVWWTALAPLKPGEREEVREVCQENDPQ